MYVDPLGAGARGGLEDATPPDRGVLGYARDRLVDVARSGLGVARDITGAKAAISTLAPTSVRGAAPEADPDRQRENLTALEDLDTRLKGWKTQKGQYYDTHRPDLLDAPFERAGSEVAGMVPMAGLGLASGPAAPVVFGGLAYGHAQSELHERIRNATPDDLKNDPGYAKDIASGVPDDQARNNLFERNIDPTKMKNLLAALPSVAGNAIGAGASNILLTRGMQRTVNEWLTDNVLRNLEAKGIKAAVKRGALGATEAGLGGAAMGAGSEATSQMEDVNAGLRPGVNVGDIASAGAVSGATFAPLGMARMGRSNPYREYGPETEVRKYPGTPRPVSPEEAAMLMNPDNPHAAYEGRPQRPGTKAAPALADDLGEEITATATAQQSTGQGPQRPPPQRPTGMPEQPAAPGGGQQDWSDITTPSPRPPPGRPSGGWGPEDFKGPEPPPPPPPPPGDPRWRRRWGEGPEDTAAPEYHREVPPLEQEYGPETRMPPDRGPEGPPRQGVPMDLEIPYADRTRIRQGLETLSPQERGALADTLERSMAQGTEPTLGVRGAEWLQPYVRGAPHWVLGELRRGIEREPGVARLGDDHVEAVNAAIRSAPERAGEWADDIGRVLDSGARTVPWARLPKSMGAARVGVAAALRRNPREVLDMLRGQEHAPEARYREGASPYGEVAPDVTRTEEEHAPTPTTEAQGAHEVAPETYSDLSRQVEEARHEAQDRSVGRAGAPGRYSAEHGPARPTRLNRPSEPLREYGEAREVDTRKPYLRTRAEKQRFMREGAAADIGLTEEGQYTPGTRARMAAAMGHTLRMPGPYTVERMQEARARAAHRQSVKQAERATFPEYTGSPTLATRTGNLNVMQRLRRVAERRAARAGVHVEPEQREAADIRHEIRVKRDEADRQRFWESREQQAGETDRQDAEQRTVAEFVREEQGRATSRYAATREMHDFLQRQPGVIAENIEIRRQAAQRTRDLRNKTARNAADYNTRERVVENTIKAGRPELIRKIESMIDTRAEHWEDRTPTGTRVSDTEKAVNTLPEMSTDQRRAFVEHARDVLEVMQEQRRLVEDELYKTHAGLGRRSAISWSVSRGQGRYLWYNQLNRLSRQADALEKLVGPKYRAEDAHLPVDERRKNDISPQRLANLKTEMTRGLLTNIWFRNKMLEKGRATELDQLSREGQTETYSYLQARAANKQRDLDAEQAARGERNAALNKAKAELNVARRKLQNVGPVSPLENLNQRRIRSDQRTELRQEVRSLEARIENLEATETRRSRDEVRLQSELNRVNRILHEMDTIKDGDINPADYEGNLVEGLDAKDDALINDMLARERSWIMDNAADYLGRFTREERVQQERERQREARAQQEQVVPPERRITERTREQRSNDEFEQRMDALQERADRIYDELDQPAPIPPDREEFKSDREHRQALETHAEQGQDRMRRRDALHAELERLDEEARNLRVEMNPELLDNDYSVGRVLDPTANMTDRRNIPAGSYVRRVTDFIDRPVSTERRGGGGGEPVRTVKRHTTLNLRMDPSRPGAAIINHFLDVVNEVSGDAHIVAMTPEQMSIALEKRGLPPGTEGFYDVRTHRILIDKNVLESDRAREVLMHEFSHPMTEVAIEQFPQIGRRLDAVRQRLRDLYFERAKTKDYLGREWVQPDNYAHPELRERLKDSEQALTNVHEFIAHLYADDGKLAEALHSVRTDDDPNAGWYALPRTSGLMAKEARFPTKGEPAPGRLPMGRTRPTQTLLERLLRTLKRGLNGLFFQHSKKRLLNEATINALDLFESVRRGGRQRPTPTDVVRPISAEGVKDWSIDRGRDASDRFREVSNYLGSGKLPMDLHNLSDMEHRGSEGIRPHVKNVSQVMDRQNASARRYIEDHDTEALIQRVARLEQTNSRAYEELQNYDADVNHWQVHGGDALGEGRNARIGETARFQQQRAMHPELQERWNNMTDVQRNLWEDIHRSFDERDSAMMQANLGQLIDAKKMIPDGAPGGIRSRLLRYMIEGPGTAEEPTLSDRETRALTRYVPGFDPADTANHAYFKAEVAKIRAMPMFRKLPVWSPSIRKGDYVVEGRYNMDSLKGRGTQIMREDGAPSGEFEFNTPQERDAFVNRVMQDERFKGVRLNDVGDIVYAKGENGEIMRDANGKPIPLTEYGERTRTRGDELEPGYHETVTEGVAKRVRPKNAGEDGIVRHRASFNPLLLEFHEKLGDAQRRHEELRGEADAGHLSLTHVEPIRDHNGTYLDPAKADRVFRQMQDSVVNSKGWRDMDETTRSLVLRDLKEAGIRAMMSTSARSAMLPRQFAQGARKDLLRNVVEYNRLSAHTLAGLEHRGELTDALKGMDDFRKSHRYWGSPNDPQGKFGVTDAKVAASMHRRAMRHPNDVVDPIWSKKLTTLLRLSYLDKLMSPMFWALQTIEPWTVSAPALAGSKYSKGLGLSAYGYLGKAMRDIHSTATRAQGFKDAYATARAGPFARLEQSDMVGRLKDNVRNDPEALELLQHMEDHSLLDRNAGLELHQTINPAAGKWGKGLDWTDHMSRQINTQIEGVNRAGVGLAAFRMARDAGASMEEAKEFARETVHETAGNYNSYASAPVFNNPWLRPMLQFKRYAGRMSSHWMRSFYNAGLAAIDDATGKGLMTREQKSAAYKRLAYMMGTATLTSGLLGLPTEPIKALLNTTQLVTGYNSDDAERMVYEGARKMLGPELGEFLAKGGFRAAGLGIGQRTGYDSLWTYGTLGTRPSDWYHAIGSFVGGAPGSYAVDAAQGLSEAANSVGHLVNGRYTEAEHSAGNAVERLFPIKVVADTVGAVRKQLGGTMYRMPSSGMAQGIQPEWWETGVQALGAQTSRQQRAGEKRAAMRSDLRDYNAGRKKIEEQYAYAEHPGERASIANQIRSFNQQWPELQPLTVGDLVKARHRYEAKQSADPSLLGVTMTRRQAPLMQRYKVYDQ
jgi:hypothetical protein